MKLAPPQPVFAATSPELSSSPPPSSFSSYTPLHTRLTSLHIHALLRTYTNTNTKQTQIVDRRSPIPRIQSTREGKGKGTKSPTSYILINPSSLKSIKKL